MKSGHAVHLQEVDCVTLIYIISLHELRPDEPHRQVNRTENHEYIRNVHSVPSRTFPDVPARVLDGGVAVHVGQQAQAEAVTIVGRVGEAVHQDAGRGRLEGLSDPVIQLVVHDGAPVLGFFVRHRLHICTHRDRHNDIMTYHTVYHIYITAVLF